MKLNDLLADVLEQLPDDRRQAVQAMTEKFGASETFPFTLSIHCTACLAQLPAAHISFDDAAYAVPEIWSWWREKVSSKVEPGVVG